MSLYRGQNLAIHSFLQQTKPYPVSDGDFSHKKRRRQKPISGRFVSQLCQGLVKHSAGHQKTFFIIYSKELIQNS